jgi:hypothetical protein
LADSGARRFGHCKQCSDFAQLLTVMEDIS